MSEPTKEYWQAKAQLCEKVAMDQLMNLDTPNAMRNLERMVYALSRVEGMTASEPCIVCGDTYTPNGLVMCNNCNEKEGK
jgi:hypothetical protein